MAAGLLGRFRDQERPSLARRDARIRPRTRQSTIASCAGAALGVFNKIFVELARLVNFQASLRIGHLVGASSGYSGRGGHGAATSDAAQGRRHESPAGRGQKIGRTIDPARACRVR